MKTAQTIEEEALLPSTLLNDEYLYPENIPIDERYINYPLRKEDQNSDHGKFKSNFSNSDLKEDISDETNDLSKEKEEQGLKKYYLTNSNNSNDLSKHEKNFSEEVGVKKWRQISPIQSFNEDFHETNQSLKILNDRENKLLNQEKDFPNVYLNQPNDNRFNSILNIFTNNLSSIVNNNFINKKNNLNYIKNERIKKDSISSNFYLNIDKNYGFHDLFKQKNPLIENKNNLNDCNNNMNKDYINNVNNINFINNINNTNIYLNKFNSIQSNKSILPKSLPYLDKENVNIFNNSINNKYLYNINNISRFNQIYNFNPETKEEKLNENINANLNQKDSPIQTKENKEKIINEFEQFCKGLKPSLVDYICSRDGSRIIQKKLNFHKNIKIKFLIKKIYTDFERIICDKYGNYFFQKLYIISSKKLRLKILFYIKNIFVTVSKDEIGVYVIQKIIEETQSEEEKKIILEYIKGNEIEMSLNKEGTHIIQKIIQIFSEIERQDLTDVLCSKNNIEKFMTNSNGINVIKRIINFNNIESNRVKLLKSIYPNIYTILKSSCSNIIDYLFDGWGINICINIINILLFNFEVFAINKYSSKIIYKIIQLCNNKCSLFIYNNNNNNYKNLSNIINLNEFIILKYFKGQLFEQNKIFNIYGNKYGKDLIIKIRNLLTFEENQIFYSFINSLKYFDKRKYELYLEIFNSY